MNTNNELENTINGFFVTIKSDQQIVKEVIREREQYKQQFANDSSKYKKFLENKLKSLRKIHLQTIQTIIFKYDKSTLNYEKCKIDEFIFYIDYLKKLKYTKANEELYDYYIKDIYEKISKQYILCEQFIDNNEKEINNRYNQKMQPNTQAIRNEWNKYCTVTIPKLADKHANEIV